MKKELLAAGLALATCVLVASPAATAAPAVGGDSATPSASPRGVSTPVPQPQESIDLPTAIDLLGRNTYPNVYGGLVGENGGRHVDVYLTELDPAIEAAFRALAPPGTLTFVKTPQSLHALNSIQERLLADGDLLAADGIEIEEFWPDTKTGKEWIGVYSLTPAKANMLGQRYGSQNIHAFDVSPSEHAVLTSGANDNSSDEIGKANGRHQHAFPIIHLRGIVEVARAVVVAIKDAVRVLASTVGLA